MLILINLPKLLVSPRKLSEQIYFHHNFKLYNVYANELMGDNLEKITLTLIMQILW